MPMLSGWENKNPQVFRSSTKSNIISGYASIQSADVAVAKIKNKNDAYSTLLDADVTAMNGPSKRTFQP